MGLLGKLWDDTVAGPHPDSGLGKLRKFNTFSPRAAKDNNEETSGRSYGEDSTDNTEGVKVTRSIMIVRPPGYHQAAGSAPTSPAGSTPPASPFSGFSVECHWHDFPGKVGVSGKVYKGNRSGAFRFRRKSMSDSNEKAANEDGSSRSTPPT